MDASCPQWHWSCQVAPAGALSPSRWPQAEGSGHLIQTTLGGQELVAASLWAAVFAPIALDTVAFPSWVFGAQTPPLLPIPQACSGTVHSSCAR